MVRGRKGGREGKNEVREGYMRRQVNGRRRGREGKREGRKGRVKQ